MSSEFDQSIKKYLVRHYSAEQIFNVTDLHHLAIKAGLNKKCVAHALGRLVDSGFIENAGSQRKPTGGSPIKLYRLAPAAQLTKKMTEKKDCKEYQQLAAERHATMHEALLNLGRALGVSVRA